MFEHRTEAEMRLYSEKMASELALKRRQKERDVTNDPTEKTGAVSGGSTENDDVVETPSGAGETPVTTGTTVTIDPE
ncbi:hypothetical protein [Streptomyces canus]|uniref:Uncharacterized protein n=1 Tax=Streptomyces canus TaxID=58343 RepID=A0AAW8FV04_9ACTN|nr:hypothetical protein [Streptomyces canus]MDQ0913674.1 hypothetical protein [Streptomyces canus]MDQ1073241.1 hypothetical protein [Streptomyces canus]